MPALLISFEFHKYFSRTDRKRLLTTIQSQQGWAQLTELAYVVKTSMDAKAMYEALRANLDPNDKLLVFEISHRYHGQHSKPIVDWLAKSC